jgi:hypothetical protein
MTQAADNTPAGRESPGAAADALFGTSARRRGVVSDEQLLQALQMQVLVKRHLGHHVPVAHILFIRGEVTVDQLLLLLRDVSGNEVAPPPAPRSLFGRIAVDCGFTSEEDLGRCLEIQAAEVKAGKPPRPLGAIMVAEGVIAAAQLEEILRLQRRQ